MNEAEERFLKVQEMLIERLEELDPNSPNYSKELEAIAKVMAENVNDLKVHSEHEAAQGKLDVEYDIETEKNRIEQERSEEEKRANHKREELDFWKIVAGFGGSVLVAVSHIWAFSRSTEKEKDDALLTNTSKTTVTEALRRGFFKFGKHE